MTIKKKRIELNLTQKEVSDLVKIPLRTYINYENDIKKVGTIKYNYIMEKLNAYGYIDEEHGILSLDKIKSIVKEIFDDYIIKFCYIFGSYAKNNPEESSDVDLLIDTDVSDIEYYELIEKLREGLKKKVDLITVKSLLDNYLLLSEILKDGIKIYG